MTFEQILTALELLRVACGTQCAKYENGVLTTYNMGD